MNVNYKNHIELITTSLNISEKEILECFPHILKKDDGYFSSFDLIPNSEIKSVSEIIDHTVLKPDTTLLQIKQLVEEGIENEVYCLCVNGSRVKELLEYINSKKNIKHLPKIAAVVGFPLGAATTQSKILETSELIEIGADEIDTVINIGYIKDNNWLQVFEEIKQIKQATKDKILKVIIETCLLTEFEIIMCSFVIGLANGDFVKTSTGFSSGGATLDNVSIIRKVVGNQLQIKASGAIRDYVTAKQFINQGVDRIGCSATLSIIQQQNQQKENKEN